jgi:methyl-accepting chemotaxis protein
VAATAMAERVVATFEEALDAGELSVEDMLDDDYVVIPNSNPRQFIAKCTAMRDRRLPPVLDKNQHELPHARFCICIGRNGYLPTHDRRSSEPQCRFGKKLSLRNRL